MTTTPGQIIGLALLDCGVLGQGQIATATDTNNALTRCNWMLSEWNRKRWLIYNLVDTLIPCTGQISYTVGPGGDFDIPRPDRLEDGCYLRQGSSTNEETILTLEATPGNPLQALLTGAPLEVGPGTQSNPGVLTVDYPLKLLHSHEDYNRIRIKNMGTFPQVIFYDSAYPLGNVYAWPIPASNYSLSILTKNVLIAFTDLAAPILLPDEYQNAIYYNLIVRLRAAYRLPADPVFIGLAKDALNVIRNANTQISDAPDARCGW